MCVRLCKCVSVCHMVAASSRDRLSLGDRGREWTSGNDVLTGEGG